MELVELGLSTPGGEWIDEVPRAPWPLLYDNGGGNWELDMRGSNRDALRGQGCGYCWVRTVILDLH
jgi:hypothetical protein